MPEIVTTTKSPIEPIPQPNPAGDLPDPEVAAPEPTQSQQELPPDSTERVESLPEMDDPDAPDDTASDFVEHRNEMQGQSALARMRASVESAATEAPAAQPGTPASPQGKSGLLDVGLGIGEAPTQTLGGIRDATQEVIDLAGELGKFKAPQLPEVDAAKSTTGGLIRSGSQFLTGFVGAGKILKPLKAISKGAKIAKGAVQGAMTDFAAFDGHDKNFANLINEFTGLKGPFEELATNPNDTELQGRFKNAVTGLGAGAIADSLLSAARLIATGRRVKGAVTKGTAKVGEFLGDVPEAEVRAAGKNPLGDAEAEGFFYSPTDTAPGVSGKLDESAQKASGMKPGEATAKPESQEVFINFARIDSPEAIKETIQQMANKDAKGIKDAQRGVRTWEQTKLSADEVNAWETLVTRRKGQPLNAEQSVASRQLWAASSGKLREMAKLASEAPTDENLFNFRKMAATHYAIQKEVIAARTETARALNSWKIGTSGKDGGVLQMQNALEAMGGKDAAEYMAGKIAKLSASGMTDGIEQFIEKSAMSKTKDAFQQAWINMLLSNPATHAANAISNFSVAVQQIYERKGAEFIAQKIGTEGGVEIGEAAAMANGMLSAFRDNLILMTKKFKGEEVVNDALGFMRDSTDIKFESKGGAFAADTWNYGSETTMGRALDATDKVLSTPTRMLSKADNVFKSIGYRMELHAQATRLATQEMRGGLIQPDAFKKRVAEIVQNPPLDIHEEAVTAATYQTFQNKPADSLNKIGTAVQQQIPVLGRLLLPFKNTPINIMTYTFERSPLAPLVKTWRADIAAGGARADIAMSRMATGTMIMQVAMDAAISGRITGKGPDHPGAKANFMRQGMQQYSIKVGDKYVSYNRTDPVGFTLGIAADLAEAMINAQTEIGEKDFSEAMVAASFAIANNVMSKTYMRGVAETFAAVSSPDTKGYPYFQKLVGSFVPAGVAAVARQGVPMVWEGDPYMRTADDIVGALRRRVPGLSQDLPLYRDLWGREVDYRSGLGQTYDLISPVYLKTHNPEPIDSEIQRLEYYPDMPERKNAFQNPYNPSISGPITLELNPKQYERFVALAGNELKLPAAMNMGCKDFLNSVVEGKSPYSAVYNMYSDGPDGGKAAYIRSWISKYRAAARQELMEKDPTLQVDFENKKAQKQGKFSPEIMGQ